MWRRVAFFSYFPLVLTSRTPPTPHLGGPLPPLNDWLPGELDGAPADVVRVLRGGGRAAPAGA